MTAPPASAPVIFSAPALKTQLRLASVVALLSMTMFLLLVPFAQTPLARVPAFIPMYQSALIVCDVTTFVLLFAQFAVERSKALFVLAGGYWFTGVLTAAHTLTFPGLFSASGLLGAGLQSTAWIYLFWHAAFPIFIIGYVQCVKERLSRDRAVLLFAGITVLAILGVALATAGESLLPVLLAEGRYTTSYRVVVAVVWSASLLALYTLWKAPGRSTLDVWLMAVMCVWICEVALAAMFNAGRFDLGFYAGRVFGLLSAGFILVVLLSQYTSLFAQAATVASVMSAERERERLADERRLLLDLERQARGEAETANRTKDQFLAMLGHELRNPLAPIRTALQLMRLRDATALVKEREVIERQVVHLVRLVDDLLDISRITRGNIVIQRRKVDIRPIVASAIEMATPLIEQRGHKFRLNIEGELWVLGDAPRLAQAICNVLINAAKFTPNGGKIRLSARREDESVVIAVRDNGVGLSSDAAEKIFEPFVQIEQQGSDRPHGGLGLGLAIVRSLVHLHGGTVDVLSEGPSKGASFEIRLPAIQAEGDAVVPDDRRPPASTTTARVMIVDDNVDAAMTLREVMQLAGHEVHVAHSGPDALMLAERQELDVAFLDIGLPVMDGYELAGLLRKRPGSQRLVMAAVTGYGRELDMQRSAGIGLAAHFVKPVSSQQILEFIDSREEVLAAQAAGQFPAYSSNKEADSLFGP